MCIYIYIYYAFSVASRLASHRKLKNRIKLRSSKNGSTVKYERLVQSHRWGRQAAKVDEMELPWMGLVRPPTPLNVPCTRGSLLKKLSGLDQVRLQSHETAMKDTSGIINDVGHRQEISSAYIWFFNCATWPLGRLSGPSSHFEHTAWSIAFIFHGYTRYGAGTSFWVSSWPIFHTNHTTFHFDGKKQMNPDYTSFVY